MNLLITLMSLFAIFTTPDYGFQQYGKETQDAIQCNGSAILKGTTVCGLTEVNGSLNADNSALTTLQVNGQTILNNCVITHAANITGGLIADNTKFQSPLNVTSQKITLKKCTVESLNVKEVKGYTGTQIVDLRGGSMIIGSIVVDSGKGEIWISPNNELSAAQITGAIILKK